MVAANKASLLDLTADNSSRLPGKAILYNTKIYAITRNIKKFKSLITM